MTRQARVTLLGTNVEAEPRHGVDISDQIPKRSDDLRASAELNSNNVELLVISHINERTHHGIRNLRVEQIDGSVIVSGHADRFYLIQLALAGAQEVLQQKGIRLHIAIESPWLGNDT
jgi:hypothetical protein